MRPLLFVIALVACSGCASSVASSRHTEPFEFSPHTRALQTPVHPVDGLHTRA